MMVNIKHPLNETMVDVGNFHKIGTIYGVFNIRGMGLMVNSPVLMVYG